jgi:hypothetical protein
VLRNRSEGMSRVYNARFPARRPSSDRDMQKAAKQVELDWD